MKRRPEVMRTERLDLTAATGDLLTADLEGPEALARALGAEVPAGWPPDLYDRSAIEWSLAALQASPRALCWPAWYMLLRRPEGTVAVGIIGYKGPPSEEGMVEIGYSVLEGRRRAGYASEAAAALVRRAFRDPRVTRVRAETYPSLLPSVRVLEKNGFRLVGPGSEEGVIRFEITREEHAACAVRQPARRDP